MTDWNPGQYLKFAGPRLQPALDLIARVPLETVGIVHDLGCGPGNVAPFLAARWPGARLVGVDSSPEMLEKARATGAEADGSRAISPPGRARRRPSCSTPMPPCIGSTTTPRRSRG